MVPQSAVDSDYGCAYVFWNVGDIAVYGYVQENLAVVAYDKSGRSATAAAVLFEASVGERTLKASAQRVDGDDAPTVGTWRFD